MYCFEWGLWENVGSLHIFHCIKKWQNTFKIQNKGTFFSYVFFNLSIIYWVAALSLRLVRHTLCLEQLIQASVHLWCTWPAVCTVQLINTRQQRFCWLFWKRRTDKYTDHRQAHTQGSYRVRPGLKILGFPGPEEHDVVLWLVWSPHANDQ